MLTHTEEQKQVRSFLEEVYYYRTFIAQGAELMSPLADLTWKQLPNEKESFQKLKESLSKAQC